jgi:hypothetical protein
MQMHPCQSSQIAAYGYEQKTGEMRVEFRDGTRWRYRNVPLAVFEGFLRTSSKGGYLNREIKEKFEGERLSA